MPPVLGRTVPELLVISITPEELSAPEPEIVTAPSSLIVMTTGPVSRF